MIGLLLLALYIQRISVCWKPVEVCLLIGIIEELGIVPILLIIKHNVTLEIHGIINFIIRLEYLSYSIYVFTIFFSSNNDCKSDPSHVWTGTLIMTLVCFFGTIVTIKQIYDWIFGN